MEEYITKEVHEEFVKRIDSENERQDKRITKLEDTIGQINELTVSVKELAVNMNNMVKEQSKFGDRLQAIEDKPSQNWDKLVWAVAGALIAGIIGYALASVGLG